MNRPGDTPGPGISFLLATLLTLAVWMLVALFPGGRTWGLAIWAWLPRLPALVVLGLAVLAAVALHVFLRRAPAAAGPSDAPLSVRRRPWLLPVALTGAVALFWWARTRTHFLGDGYTLLSLLAADRPFLKTRQLGEALLHVWVKDLSGLEGQQGALFSFRFLSILSGTVCVGVVAWAAARLFQDRRSRVLFSAGVLTGGYMLLYFGYVENYSLFVTSVCAFVLVGLLVAQGRLWRGWLLVPLGAAIFFHIMGVTLIPGAVYLLLAPTRLGQRARGWPPRTWAALAVLVGAAGFSAVAYFRHTSVFFRLAVLPLYDGRLTNGYTVLSPAHLGDFLNLIPLLLPAAGLLALALVGFVKSRRPVTRPFAFLVVAVLSTLGAAFIFEPELGMPRDWDLFAFAGVPLVVGFYYLVLNGRRERRPTVEVAALGILLGAAALGGRVATLRDEQVSLRPIAHYIALDPARMSPVFHILREYYAARGDALAADSVEAEWRKHNPEAELTSRAVDLIEMGQYAEAAALARRAIEINAAHWSGYAELGAALIRMQRYDSALSCLQMAGGLNPYSPRILHNLALCYDRTGDWRKAEQLWQKAYRLDTTQTPTLVELCRLYQIRRLPDKLLAALERLADQPDAPPEGLAKLADMYAEAGRLPEAGEVFRRAVQAGLDTALARQIVAARPRLKSFVPGFP